MPLYENAESVLSSTKRKGDSGVRIPAAPVEGYDIWPIILRTGQIQVEWSTGNKGRNVQLRNKVVQLKMHSAGVVLRHIACNVHGHCVRIEI